MEEEADVSTPLIRAASVRCLNSIRSLLADGAEVNAQNKHGLAALMFSAHRNDSAVARTLLDHGADVNLSIGKGYKAGCPALILAVNWCHLDMVRLLLERGADVNAMIKRDRRSVLLYAVSLMVFSHERLKVEVIQLLLKYGADVNAADKMVIRRCWQRYRLLRHLPK